jgi:uncharacterized C2H2 Zn-finger protein
MAEWVDRSDEIYFYCPKCGRFCRQDLSGGDYDEFFTCPKCGKEFDPENEAFGEFPFWQAEKVEGYFRCRECGLIHKTLEGAYECHTGHDPSWWIRGYVKYSGMKI